MLTCLFHLLPAQVLSRGHVQPGLPKVYTWVINHNVVCYPNRFGDSRIVTVTLHGPLMRYDGGAGLLDSRQLTLSRTIQRLRTEPMKVVMLEDDWADRLAMTVKVRSLK